MIDTVVEKLSRGLSLSEAEMEQVIIGIAQGFCSEDQIVKFLSALSEKKETAAEITGAVRALRCFVSPVRVNKDIILDTCGTGGDGKQTFNISTIAAFIVAGAGVTVCKHGNRAVSGACGSADLLESMGVNIKASVEVVEKCIEEIGLGFLFAPALHPVMAAVGSARKRLGARTIFNILGPLINPAMPTHQLLGVYDEALVPIVGEALKNLGIRHAMVVWGEGGFDEVITMGPTRVCEVKDANLKEYHVTPGAFGIEKADVRDIIGGDIDTNRHIASRVLKGMEGPERDIVLLNVGCCLYLAGRAHTIKDGIKLGAESLDSGAAIKKLNKLIEFTNN